MPKAYFEGKKSIFGKGLVSTTQYSTVASIVHVTSPVRPVVNLLSAPQPVLSLLSQFPTRPYSAAQPVKHSVLHHLTTNGTPVHARARRLPPDKLNAARAEFQHMLELGIIRPSRPLCQCLVITPAYGSEVFWRLAALWGLPRP